MVAYSVKCVGEEACLANLADARFRTCIYLCLMMSPVTAADPPLIDMVKNNEAAAACVLLAEISRCVRQRDDTGRWKMVRNNCLYFAIALEASTSPMKLVLLM